MGTRVLRAAGPASADLRAGVAAIQAELKVTPEFPAEVQHAAERDASNPACRTWTAPTWSS